MTPIAPVRATCVPPHADRSKSGTSIRRSSPCARRLLAQRQRLRLVRGREPDRHRAVVPHHRFASSTAALDVRRRRLAREVDRRGLGAQVKAHGRALHTRDRTPPTARAGRCAAACDRSGAPSRSRRAPPCPVAQRRDRARARTAPSSSTTSTTVGAAEHADVERLAAGRGIERGAVEHRPPGRPSCSTRGRRGVERRQRRRRCSRCARSSRAALDHADRRRRPRRSPRRAARSCRSGRTARRPAPGRSSCASARSRGRARRRAG